MQPGGGSRASSTVGQRSRSTTTRGPRLTTTSEAIRGTFSSSLPLRKASRKRVSQQQMRPKPLPGQTPSPEPPTNQIQTEPQIPYYVLLLILLPLPHIPLDSRPLPLQRARVDGHVQGREVELRSRATPRAATVPGADFGRRGGRAIGVGVVLLARKNVDDLWGLRSAFLSHREERAAGAGVEERWNGKKEGGGGGERE